MSTWTLPEFERFVEAQGFSLIYPVDTVYSDLVREGTVVQVQRWTRGVGDEVIARYRVTEKGWLRPRNGKIRDPRVQYEEGYVARRDFHYDDWQFGLAGRRARPGDDPQTRWARLGQYRHDPPPVAAASAPRAASPVPPAPVALPAVVREPAAPRRRAGRSDAQRLVDALGRRAAAGGSILFDVGAVQSVGAGRFRSTYDTLRDAAAALGASDAALYRELRRGEIELLTWSALPRARGAMVPPELVGGARADAIEYAIHVGLDLGGATS